MRARYYSPAMKRFINADVIAGAISNAITLNRFAYANGNPVSLVDPFGLSVDTKDASKNTIANKIDGLFKKWKSIQRAKNFFKGTLSDIIQIPELYSVEAYYENVIFKIPGDLELYYKITTTEGNGPISFNATDVFDLINQKTIKEQFTKLADMYPVEGGIKLPFPNNDEYVAQYLLAKAEFNTAKNSLTVTTAYNLNCSDDNGNAIDIEIGIKKDFDTDNKTHLEAYADAMDSIFYLMKNQNTDMQKSSTDYDFWYDIADALDQVFESEFGFAVTAGFMAASVGLGMGMSKVIFSSENHPKPA